MFIATQFIGLLVLSSEPLKVNVISPNGTISEQTNPYLSWIAPPEADTGMEFASLFSQIIFAFILAIIILFFLMKFKFEVFLKAWFFLVVVIALFISFLAFEKIIPLQFSMTASVFFAFVLALSFAYLKIYAKRMFIHNFTELLVYPGISVVFVPLLNVYTIFFLLIVISIYDFWAVWKSGIMQKMAKYQMNKLNIFSGFFIPYMSKKLSKKIKLMKSSKSNKKIKVHVAILGGGDVIFPLITAGVMMHTFGFISALFVIFGAAVGLSYLLFFAEKKKFYPAMPFITAGIMLGFGIWKLLNF
jgi:presenilin-like A22 family membrane protease